MLPLAVERDDSSAASAASFSAESKSPHRARVEMRRVSASDLRQPSLIFLEAFMASAMAVRVCSRLALRAKDSAVSRMARVRIPGVFSFFGAAKGGGRSFGGGR